jgi:hypothetical protein
MTQKALLLMGCPEVPVQTPIVLYILNKLKKDGIDGIIAGTNAALNILKFSDPERHYIKNMIDLDQCIEDIVEKRTDFDLCFVFVHNDAGISYAATMASISEAKLFVVLFGRDAQILAETIDFDCKKIVAKAIHNPMPLARKIDEVIG